MPPPSAAITAPPGSSEQRVATFYTCDCSQLATISGSASARPALIPIRTSAAIPRWSQPDSNRRPRRCKRRALPAELWPLSPDCRRLGLACEQALGPVGLGQVLVGVVAGADQGAGGDRLEAEVVGGPLEGGELV